LLLVQLSGWIKEDVVRAITPIQKGEELTINYRGDDEMLVPMYIPVASRSVIQNVLIADASYVKAITIIQDGSKVLQRSASGFILSDKQRRKMHR
jgi:hypothetical protein